MKEIELTQGRTTLISDEDYESVNKRKWYYKSSGNDRGYAVTTINGKLLYLHVYIALLIWRAIPEGCQVDHVALGSTLDNRRENLRIASKCQNSWNRGPTRGKRSCGYKGVSLRQDLVSKPWTAVIQANHKRYHLGYFATAEEAARAYNEAAARLHGEFCFLNEVGAAA